MSARTVVVCFLSVAMSIGLAGCASGEKQSGKRTGLANDSLFEIRNEVANARKQHEATIAALNKLVAQGSGNRRANFELYMKEVARLQAQADKARARADDLHARPDAYIARWQEEVPRARRARSRLTIAGVQAAARAAGIAYGPLLQDLRDVQTALGNDLTDAGVTAVKPAATRATADAGVLQGHLDALLAEVDRLRGEVSPRT